MTLRFYAQMLLAGMLLAGCASAQPKTFTNPILTGMNPDPSICRVDETYYLVTSTFEYFPGLPIYQSKDLVHWKLIGHAGDSTDNNPLQGSRSSGGQYAATIRYHNGKFYVIGTNYATGGVFYVTAENPAGPWSEAHWLDLYFVDPSFLFEDGKAYFLSPDNAGNFLLGMLDLETDTFEKPLKQIASGLGGSSPEGPHLYKINGYYYLMSAEGGTGYDHREVIQRSKSPWGPYEASPINPVLSHMNDPDNPFHAIGHADLIQLPDESWWTVCLGIRPRNGKYHHLGRETFLAPITWNAEGWPKVGSDGIVKPEYPVPNLPEHVWETEPVRDNFDRPELRLAWNFLRNPYDADWSLSEKPGSLRLNGSKVSARDQDSPAYVCRRQTAFDMIASTQVDFTPTAPNEEAGLLVRGNDANHYDFVITRRAGKRVVLLRQFLQDKEVALNSMEIGTGSTILRISATDREYSFWVQEEGQTAVRIGTATTKDLSTEIITGFIGTYIGMYASGNGKANTNPADFDWFEYENDPETSFIRAQEKQASETKTKAPFITSIQSLSHDVVKLKWNGIAEAAEYVIERYDGQQFKAIGCVTGLETSFTDTGLTGKTLYQYRIITDNTCASISSSVLTRPAPGPFAGTASQIPGKIEAEHFDYGEYNEAYFDEDRVNAVEAFRTEGMDVEYCWDRGNTYNLCQLIDGEWVRYTVDVNQPTVDVQLRVTSPQDGRIRLELDGNKIAEADIKSTDGWHNWTTVTLPDVKMEPGKNRQLKVIFVKGGFNLNWMRFE